MLTRLNRIQRGRRLARQNETADLDANRWILNEKDQPARSPPNHWIMRAAWWWWSGVVVPPLLIFSVMATISFDFWSNVHFPVRPSLDHRSRFSALFLHVMIKHKCSHVLRHAQTAVRISPLFSLSLSVSLFDHRRNTGACLYPRWLHKTIVFFVSMR